MARYIPVVDLDWAFFSLCFSLLFLDFWMVESKLQRRGQEWIKRGGGLFKNNIEHLRPGSGGWSLAPSLSLW
jgi:hypothetical protein